MQSFLYYGGLENADYHPIFGKGHEQLGNGFGHQALYSDMRLQPYGRMTGAGPGTGGKTIRPPVIMKPAVMPSGKSGMKPAVMPSGKPSLKPAGPKSLWQRAKEFLKEHKIISRGLSGIQDIASKSESLKDWAPYIGTAKDLASISGYGKKKKQKRKHKAKKRARK